MKIAAWLLVGCYPVLAQDAAELFRNHCSTCHRVGSATAAPLPEALRGLAPQTIVAALESGKMRVQGSLLSPAERNLVANYLGKAESTQTIPPSASCATGEAGAGVFSANFELLTDPQGVDFRPYLSQVLAAVRRNWLAVIDSAKLSGQGTVGIQFPISRAGSVLKLVIVRPSGTDSLDRVAVAGISASNPFPPLPSEYKSDRIILQGNFTYDLGWNGWGNDAVNSRFQTAAGLRLDTVPKLKLKWAFGYAGVTTAFGSPTVFRGRVYAGAADGAVYSLDARSGCLYWTYRAAEGVRTAILISDDGQAAYFGDLQGNMYGVNATTGALLWKTRVDEHLYAEITGSPKLYAGRLYVPVSGGAEQVAAANPAFECCTFRGSMAALDAKTGTVLWKAYSIAEAAKTIGQNASGTIAWGPSGAALWSSPTVDAQRKAVYAATGVNYSDPPTPTSDAVLAFDLESGRLLWSRQLLPADVFNFGCTTEKRVNCPAKPGNDADIGAPPILRTLVGGRRLLIVGAKSGVVYGLDPDHEGAIVWQTRLASGGPQGGVMWGAAADDKTAFFALSDWNPGKPEAGGGVAGIEIGTGKKLWSVPAPIPACLGTPGCSAAQPAPVTLVPGVLFAGSLDGHLRAYDAKNGATIWEFDTRPEFPTVNGIRAHGGSMNGTGPVVADGMVFANSGYSRLPVMPGNVLLAFSVQ